MSITFVINCTAMGIPTPEVIWRLNWGHVPDKCRQTSTPTVGNRALGVLECPDAQVSDQGAYSCEAINSKGSCFAGSPGCGQPGQVRIENGCDCGPNSKLFYLQIEEVLSALSFWSPKSPCIYFLHILRIRMPSS